ncbi:14270_t:CDS:2, partial [Racocetra persica]
SIILLSSDTRYFVSKSNSSSSITKKYKKLFSLEFLSSNDHTEKQKDKSSEHEVELDRETVDIPINNPYDSRYDLCESIPGLYRLLDLCKDKGSNGL